VRELLQVVLVSALPYLVVPIESSGGCWIPLAGFTAGVLPRRKMC